MFSHEFQPLGPVFFLFSTYRKLRWDDLSKLFLLTWAHAPSLLTITCNSVSLLTVSSAHTKKNEICKLVLSSADLSSAQACSLSENKQKNRAQVSLHDAIYIIMYTTKPDCTDTNASTQKIKNNSILYILIRNQTREDKTQTFWISKQTNKQTNLYWTCATQAQIQDFATGA